MECHGERLEGEKMKSSDGGVGPSSSRINERISSSSAYWELLLQNNSLNVLLVEHDTAARLVIAVLLQKCGYRVTVAANGLQAWKILMDLSNQIDLVLSEVDLPCLSGVALLCIIMKHNIRQHTPVVMMSFGDNINVVFKCLSEGAVDYLLKPVRKNELKNLWRHIWRKWHSSCGSESGIGAQPKKTVRLKDVEIFGDNNSNSNNEDDNASFGLNDEGESDNGSGAQSSWSKPNVEVNSSQPLSSLDQIAEKPDSNCALAICSNVSVSDPQQLPTTATREHLAHQKQLDSREFQCSNTLLKNFQRNEAFGFKKEGTPLHLGVKRLREDEGVTSACLDGHNLLRNGCIAMITRLQGASNANKASCISKESSSSRDHYLEALLKDGSASRSMEKWLLSCPVFASMEKNLLCTHQLDSQGKVDDMAVREMLVQPIATHQELQIQHLDNYNHHHHLVRNIQQKLPPNYEDLSIKKMEAAAPQSWVSNIHGSPAEGHRGSSVLDGNTSTCRKGGKSSN